MIHDSAGSGEHNVAELTRRQQSCTILLQVANVDVKARRNHTAFVDAACQVNHNLSGTMIVNNLELANVAYKKETKN